MTSHCQQGASPNCSQRRAARCSVATEVMPECLCTRVGTERCLSYSILHYHLDDAECKAGHPTDRCPTTLARHSVTTRCSNSKIPWTASASLMVSCVIHMCVLHSWDAAYRQNVKAGGKFAAKVSSTFSVMLRWWQKRCSPHKRQSRPHADMRQQNCQSTEAVGSLAPSSTMVPELLAERRCWVKLDSNCCLADKP